MAFFDCKPLQATSHSPCSLDVSTLAFELWLSLSFLLSTHTLLDLLSIVLSIGKLLKSLFTCHLSEKYPLTTSYKTHVCHLTSLPPHLSASFSAFTTLGSSLHFPFPPKPRYCILEPGLVSSTEGVPEKTPAGWMHAQSPEMPNRRRLETPADPGSRTTSVLA